MLSQYYNEPRTSEPVLVLSKEFLERTVIGCMVICKGSAEDTQEFLREIYGIDISTSNISNIINRAADKAKEFNESVPLNQIKVGAHDEIFQTGNPVLVDVNVYCTFVYLRLALKPGFS